LGLARNVLPQVIKDGRGATRLKLSGHAYTVVERFSRDESIDYRASQLLFGDEPPKTRTPGERE
jgi:hypothetical protein